MAVPGMIGIDVSKDQLVAALTLAGSCHPKWEATFPNSAQGVKQLLRRTPAAVAWVIEPTGRYSIGPAKLAQAAGQVVLLAPPRKAKAYLNSLQDRAKTDKLDARGLALFGLSRDVTEPLRPYPIKKAEVEEVDQLLSARKGLARARSSLRLQAKELSHAREILVPALKALDAQINAVDEQIAALMQRHEQFVAARQIDAVEGIGPVTAAAVTARLAAKGFQHPDEFVAYTGLDIGIVQSGKRRGERGLTHQGDAELRRLLFLCAQATLRSKKSPFIAQYERELAKGLCKTAAICAVARKMAKVCWSLYTHGATYDPDRVYQQPKAKGAADAAAAGAPGASPGV